MRLATGATHARDTREKAPVFIRAPPTGAADPYARGRAAAFFRPRFPRLHLSARLPIAGGKALVTLYRFR